MVDGIWPPFLAPAMITTDVLPAPVLHGISLPEPQMWAPDHSGSVRAHPFQIHSGDKDSSLGLKCMPGMWAARVWEDQRRMKNTGGGEWDAENPTRQCCSCASRTRHSPFLAHPSEALCPMPFSYTLFLHLLKSITALAMQSRTQKHFFPNQSNHQTRSRKRRPLTEKCKQARVVHEKGRNHGNGDKEALSERMNQVSVHPRQMMRGARCLNWLVIAELFLQCLRICESHILFLSCTVLFETLAKRCTWEAIESWLRWSYAIFN